MPLLPIINQAPGPLPLKETFKAPADGPVAFIVTGSVWSQQPNQLIGVALELDGVPIGQAYIFSNGSSTHRAVVPAYISVDLTFGSHTVALLASNSATTSDANDYFNVVLQY